MKFDLDIINGKKINQNEQKHFGLFFIYILYIGKEVKV